MQSDKKQPGAAPKFEKVFKSYLGFLEGTGKSKSTISSYRADLELFKKFLDQKKYDFFKMRPTDFEGFLAFLEKMGRKTNTRRRKLLTVRSLYRYAVVRKKMTLSPAQFVGAPKRLERLPWIPSAKEVDAFFASLPKTSLTGLRNRTLVALLAETALSVAELCALRWEQVEGSTIVLDGKRARKIKVSKLTQKNLQEWRKTSKGKFLFPGFNRHGITTEKMTSRGVELVFKDLAKAHGFQHLKPKTLRHYAITHWLEQNVAEKEILYRLGVSDTYSLEPYRKYLNDKHAAE